MEVAPLLRGSHARTWFGLVAWALCVHAFTPPPTVRRPLCGTLGGHGVSHLPGYSWSRVEPANRLIEEEGFPTRRDLRCRFVSVEQAEAASSFVMLVA